MGLLDSFRPMKQAADFKATYAEAVAEIDGRLAQVAAAFGGETVTNPHGTAGYAHGLCDGRAFALYPVTSGVQTTVGTRSSGELRDYLELVVDNEIVWRRGASAPVVDNPWRMPTPRKPKVEHLPDFVPPTFDVDTVVTAIKEACGSLT